LFIANQMGWRKSSSSAASSPKLKSLTSLCFQVLPCPGRALSFLQCLPWLFGNPNCSHTMTPTQMTVIQSECFHLNYMSRHSTRKLPHRLGHYNPWEGATCRTYFHCSVLSLFIATTVRNIPLIQTGVLTSVSHQPRVTLSNRNALSMSKPQPPAQRRRA